MKNMVITISRQYGSGGREIGEKLAGKLGYSYYDTLLLEKAAQDSGLSKSVMERYDEKLTDKWLNLSFGGSMYQSGHLPLPMQAALSQFEAIHRIGQSGSAVIVGRCADFVLREQKNVLSVFIHADKQHRLARVMARNDIGESEAEKRIRNTDKHRAAYHNYYSDKEWGHVTSYDVSIDSGLFGIDGSVDVLLACIQALQ